MSEIYTELSPSFTTADTIGPVRISFAGDELSVEFAVFRSPIQKIVFRDARAFSWSGWEGTSPLISPDRIYQVSGSSFLEPWLSFSSNGLRFTHFKLGFNAEAKYLDVIATRVEEEPNQPLQRNASTGSVSSFESPARRG